jgi:hypothetical protein
MGFSTVLTTVLITIACYQVAWVINSYLARGILLKWVEANNYHLLKAELRMLRRGPFLWTTSKYDKVFYFRVRQSNRRIVKGWVCFRAKTLFPGNQLSKYDVTIHWDLRKDN